MQPLIVSESLTTGAKEGQGDSVSTLGQGSGDGVLEDVGFTIWEVFIFPSFRPPKSVSVLCPFPRLQAGAA